MMDTQKIAFKKAGKSDQKLIQAWLDKPHIKEYWDNAQEIMARFESSLKKGEDHRNFWICFYHQEPFGLMITLDVTVPNPHAKEILDHLTPWIEPEGKTLIFDFVIAEEVFLGKGLASEVLKKFIEVLDVSDKALLADPEVKNEKGIHILEKAGFVKVSTFIRGQGFFRGKPHYLLKLKIPHRAEVIRPSFRSSNNNH